MSVLLMRAGAQDVVDLVKRIEMIDDERFGVGDDGSADGGKAAYLAAATEVRQTLHRLLTSPEKLDADRLQGFSLALAHELCANRVRGRGALANPVMSQILDQPSSGDRNV